MAFLSLPSDPVHAWVKIDLQLHQPYRTLLGFGRLRCDWCGERWGRHGCPSRESAARLFVHTASRPQQEAALAAEEITPADLQLRPRRPAPGRPAPAPPTGRHRRSERSRLDPTLHKVSYRTCTGPSEVCTFTHPSRGAPHWARAWDGDRLSPGVLTDARIIARAGFC